MASPIPFKTPCSGREGRWREGCEGEQGFPVVSTTAQNSEVPVEFGPMVLINLMVLEEPVIKAHRQVLHGVVRAQHRHTWGGPIGRSPPGTKATKEQNGSAGRAAAVAGDPAAASGLSRTHRGQRPGKAPSSRASVAWRATFSSCLGLQPQL